MSNTNNDECPNPEANVMCVRCWGVYESNCACGRVGNWCKCDKPKVFKSPVSKRK